MVEAFTPLLQTSTGQLLVGLICLAVGALLVGLFALTARLVRLRRSLTRIARTTMPETDSRRYSLAELEYSVRQLEDTLSSIQAMGNGKKVSVERKLSELCGVAADRLNAAAIEIALGSEGGDSGPPRVILYGEPTSAESQLMLGESMRRSAKTISHTIPRRAIFSRPLTFAGISFGTLRVELEDGVKADRRVDREIELLSLRISLSLLDDRFAEELMKMRTVSEESLRAKTGFLANLSHEIRGPLGVIINAVEINLDGLVGELNEAQRETLEMVKSNSAHLLDLVNDVLDFAKVEAGKITVESETLEVNEFLQEMAKVVQTQARAKKHSLKVSTSEESLYVRCDRRHARQMLINLLTNAIKYTPEGGSIEVSGSLAAEHMIKIAVKDSGIGIPESERHKVLGAFERVNDPYALQQMGTGLGMPLTKSLAKVNKGNLDFESTKGEGSCFWILLPQASQSEEGGTLSRSIDSLVTPNSLGKGEQILLFDRNSDTSDMVERYLSFQGFRITVVKSEEVLYQRTTDGKWNLVMVDLDGCEGSDQEIIDTTSQLCLSKNIPLAVLSSRAFLFDVEDSLKRGVDRYLSKPLPLKELAANVRSVLDASHGFEGKEEITALLPS